ncbi:MAG: hypothetical protein J5662_03450 [Clostridia bacterium]|nr:hypothetical protein [Clostridia bacterium]
MKYPGNLKNVIDVTKAPYYADNTGKTDCTQILRRVFDDLLLREIEGVKETERQLCSLGENDVYIGFESRIEKNLVRVIFPEFVRDARIIFFPEGTYLVSDTVTYTHKNLKNIFDSKPGFELSRGIHILGESRECTVIKLKDNCGGFKEGGSKPVLSLINEEGALENALSNVSQMNTVADLTVDCGTGNPGAAGLRFIANNSGRIENVSVNGNNSDTGIQLAAGSEGVIRNVSISGFKTGIYAYKTSVCVYDRISFFDISGSPVSTGRSSAVFCDFAVKDNGEIEFFDKNGNYAVINCLAANSGDNQVCFVNSAGDVFENGKEIESVDFTHISKLPRYSPEINAGNYAVVEDYGAVGDGAVDSTAAIQKAFDSGKEIILFTGGHYLVNGNITVPKTVKKIDFMFCDFFAGENLINGTADALFTVNEAGDIPLFMEHLYTFEQFYGHFRLVCHAARRDLILKDIHTQTAAAYFNTVPGSKVYFDNCACTVGTYSNDAIISRKGFKPEFCGMIPFEFHGQRVLAFNLNPERADIEVLNDNSEFVCLGFKVEGPGTAIKTINGGKTAVFVFSCGIGDITAKNALFENTDSSVCLFSGMIFGVADTLDYNLILKSTKDGAVKRVYKSELEKITKYRVNYTLIDKR